MQLTEAANNVSESAMLNSSKAIKFACLQKIAYLSMLYGARVKEMQIHLQLFLWKKQTSWLFDKEKKTLIEKIYRMMEIYF